MFRKKFPVALPMPSSFWALSSHVQLLQALLVVLLFCTVVSCQSNDRLPILGQKELVIKTVNGKSVTDSVDHTVPNFSFVSQYGDTVTANVLDGKIYVADFFFTTCPTICPKMKTQLKRVYERFKGNPGVMILSHTIDPTHDTVPVLREFAENLGVTGGQWLFVTGDKEKIFDIGQNSYMVSAAEDTSAPGGVVHSGAFILVDTHKHIRGIYDGTTVDGVDKLMDDMDKLLAEPK